MVDAQASIRPDAVDPAPVPLAGGVGPMDGRTARALRTHDAIVDACIDLVCEDDLRPTAQSIANRAGVSVRSVFQHFADLESLYAAVAERSATRVARLVAPIDGALPLDERMRALVRQRAELFEALQPIRRAADVHAPFSTEIQRRLKAGHDLLREQAAEVFAPELGNVPQPERDQLRDAIDLCLAWPSWDLLRTMHGRSIEWVEDVLLRQLRALIDVAGRSA